MVENSRESTKITIEKVPDCAWHPGVMAVRLCGECGSAICGVCAVYYAGKDYCPRCLPKESQGGAAPPLAFSDNFAPAGFVFRGFIKLLEISALVCLATYFSPGGRSVAGLVAYVALLAAGFAAYFTVPVVIWGATPLQRLFGVSVIDWRGDAVTAPAALVRTGYLALTLFTIVPALGYMAAWWDKYHRGWHDRLAETVVVTSNPYEKEKIGAAGILLMLALAWTQHVALHDWITGILIATVGGPAPIGEQSAPHVWKTRFTGEAVYTGSFAVAIIDGKVTAVNIADGRTIWISRIVNAITLNYDGVLKRIYAVMKDSVIALSQDTGEMIWKYVPDEKGALSVASSKHGIYVYFGQKLFMIDMSGKFVWKKDLGEPITSITAVKGGALAVTETGAKLINVRGVVIASYAGLFPAQKIEDDQWALTGWAGASVVNTRTGKTIWSKSDTLHFPDASAPQGDFVYAAEGAFRKSDGVKIFGWPEGCVYTGYVKDKAITYCRGERSLAITSRETGGLTMKFKSPGFDRLEAITDHADYYGALTEERWRDGIKRARFLAIARGLTGISATSLGDFVTSPKIYTHTATGRLFIIGGGVMGLYKPVIAN